MSFSAISLYDNVNTKDINKFKDIEYYFSEEFQYTTLGLTMQLDSNYTPLLFSDSVNNENKEYVKDEFNHRLEDVKSFMHMDKDFFYIAKTQIQIKLLRISRIMIKTHLTSIIMVIQFMLTMIKKVIVQQMEM